MFQYLNGNGVNATFFIGKTDSRLTSSVVSQVRKQNGVSMTHRRWELTRTDFADILSGADTVGQEPLSVKLTISGSTSDVSQAKLALMLQDVIAVANESYITARNVGVSPREISVGAAEVVKIGLPSTAVSYVTN